MRKQAAWQDERVAEEYEARRFASPLQRRKHRRDEGLVLRLLRRAGVRGAVLDLPCGTGRLLRALGSLEASVTGTGVARASVIGGDVSLPSGERVVAPSFPHRHLQAVSGDLPWAVCLAIIVREAIVAAGAVVLGLMRRAKLEVRYLGKVATLGLYAAIAWFFVARGTDTTWLEVSAWIAVVPSLVLYYVVAGQYVADARDLLRGTGAVSSDT